MSELKSTVESVKPFIPASQKLPELTLRAIVISIILALVLAASNAYLALKIGTTISASVPASVFALGLLRFFKNSNILESNIIQTAASAGEGMAAAMSFILPAMLLLGVWQGFPYWETVIIGMLGGLLGVMISIPLRRVLLHMPTLKFPEGTAVGNVLKSASKGGAQLKYILRGGAIGAAVSFCQSGLQVMGETMKWWVSAGKSLFGLSFGLTSATLAAGYIIGFETGMSLLFGLVVGWLIILPLLGVHFGLTHPNDLYQSAMDLWDVHLRYVGVGTMIVGGIWTLLRLSRPLLDGLKLSFAGFAKSKNNSSAPLLRTEKDFPIQWVTISVLFLALVTYAFLFYEVFQIGGLGEIGRIAIICLFSLAFILIVGFLLASICGYFVGMLGSTNNPLSGLMIVGILLLSLICLTMFHDEIKAHMLNVLAYVILMAGVIAGIGSISGENMQDLKAGQIIGATPWKQQLMLAVGVVVSVLVIGPILNLLYHAYGMAGNFPRPGMDHAQMLAAPQASLMAAVAKGVLTHHLEWSMIIIGCIVAVVTIFIDEIIRSRTHFRLPALAVGLAIYLPPEIMTPIIMGSAINYLVKSQHRLKARTKVDKQICHDNAHRAILLACGMVAGSSIMGVLLAIPFAIKGNSNALAIVPPSFAPYANFFGVIVFGLLCLWFYRTGIFKKKK